MTHGIIYCKHCGIEYQHQFSGEGCLEQKSSRNYCKDCNVHAAPIEREIKEFVEYKERIKERVLKRYRPEKQGVQFWKETTIVDFDILFKWMSKRPNKTWQTVNDAGVKMLECKEPYSYEFVDQATFRIGVTKEEKTIVEVWTYKDNNKEKPCIKNY